ncbi:16S rRNA (cytosine(1402)-N(4))-methyltransferase RsmH [Candidatus Saccharibacteria bacterium]|nr:16S rRNA (cytosine(1402)-N(4))-methyltransferase RsmH [Candidatus Saccharibacteria bacterium]
MNDYEQLHRPVLVDKVLELLAPKRGESYLDLTAGYGGHARRILQMTNNYQQTVLVDRDSHAIAALTDLKKQGATLKHASFAAAIKELVNTNQQFDLVLMDLGVSSPQLDRAERGFSFSKPAPLDMRMDDRQAISAADIVNNWSELKLAGIFMRYGEIRPKLAKLVATKIIEQRPLETTTQLADLIRRQVHVRQKTHPATQFFQAIRIAVNDELTELDSALKLMPKLLKSGGRVGVISFHSLEDRIVKNYFKQESKKGLEAEFELINRKPVSGEDYDDHNPRARSAKLRAATRI